MQHGLTKELPQHKTPDDFVTYLDSLNQKYSKNWFSQLVSKYLKEWKGQPGDSQKIYDFLVKNENQSDFFSGLKLFKDYLNNIHNPIHSSDNPNHISRIKKHRKFLDTYYHEIHPELKILKEMIDTLLQRYIKEPSYFFKLSHIACEMILGIGQYIITNKYEATAIIYGIFSQFSFASAQQNTAYQPKSNEELTHDAIKSICSQKPFLSANSAEIKYTKYKNTFSAWSCLDHLRDKKPATIECRKDNEAVRDFLLKTDQNKAIMDELDIMREQYQSQQIFNQAQKLINSRKITSQFSSEQLKKFNDYIKLLDLIHRNKYYANIGKKLKAGNCQEHAAHAAISIFKINKEYDTFTKIQLVSVGNHSGDRHRYLLINSDVEDIDITNNPVETEKYLSSIKTGYYCDTWNKGTFEEVAGNKDDFYKKWDSVKSKSLSEYFDLSDLPRTAAEFIEKKIHQLDLSHLLKKPNYFKMEL